MITVENLKQRLDWDRVDEQSDPEHGLVYLFVRPTTAELEPVYFCLGEDRTSVVQFGFGDWHCHPDELEEAIITASQLVRGERCVVEECDGAGRYQGGGLYDSGGLPETLGTNVKSLRRVFFNRKPIIEEIDFSRYFRGKHIWVSHDRKAEIERLYRDLGVPIEDW